MDMVDTLVIGAGVIGLAVARALARDGHEVIVLEANGSIGEETSSRNSEVIHAGIYYLAGSLMARSCVAGKQALYEFCRSHDVASSRCGKLIVATLDAEVPRLHEIKARAAENGVDDLLLISAAEARVLEPALSCKAALLSPSTGIIDSHAYMTAVKGDAEADGAAFAFRSTFLAARAIEGGIEADVGGKAAISLRCRNFVNAAGLHAPRVAQSIQGLERAFVPTAYYAKGSYFVLSGRAPFSRLIYPVPVQGGLGTHLTLDLAGQARFGPDVEWVETIDYKFDPGRAAPFYAAIRRYWPELPDNALLPGYSGIRPKVVPPGVAGQDFVIQSSAAHNVPGVINLFGIESPGLTASLAIAEEVRQLCSRR